jgi:hypothetical protein
MESSLELAPGAQVQESELLPFFSESELTTAWNLVLTGECLQVLGQRLLLGETDDARDLAAGSPAHGALKLSQAVLLPFAWHHRSGDTGMGKEATVPLLPTSGLPRSPCNLPVITRYERPRGLTLVPVICSVTVDL